MTRNGKIARLPYEIREELNHRLERNVPGITLVDWLNSLPEVQEVCHDLFDGNPIIPQNLSQWRQGGFAEWQARNDLFERACQADDLEDTMGLMADRASQLLATRFAIALAQWPIAPTTYSNEETHDSPIHDSTLQDSPPSPVPSSITALKPLIPLARAISQLRRADRDHARQKIEQYHFDRKVRADESYAALWAGFRREDAEKAAAARAAAAAAEQASTDPPSAPAPAPKPKSTKSRSHQITPLSPHYKKTRRPKKRAKKVASPTSAASALAPSPTAVDPSPPTDPPIGPMSPIGPIPPISSESPTTPTAVPPESDWELRNRPLPDEPEPAWRTQLRLQKTIPPWELPSYSPPPPPPLRSIIR